MALCKCLELSLLLLFLYKLASAEVCPKKIKDVSGDFNARARFDKIRGKQNNFELTYTHEREKGEADDTYTYHINFCGDGKDGVVQEDKKEKKKYSIGTLKQSTLIGGEDWIFLMYYNGSTYGSHCATKSGSQPRESWIMIRCEDQGEKPKMRLVQEARYKNGPSTPDNRCHYLFEYNHPDACNHNHKLSGGAKFLIILLSLFGAYFLLGFLYQRFYKQAKGFEQIPNFSFWRKIGNMSADGCDFVCRRQEHPNTYKGMADALDIESSDDEDKDDGLLPM